MRPRDDRSKRDHEPHGWKPSAHARPTAGLVLMECPCGWLGWVRKDTVES